MEQIKNNIKNVAEKGTVLTKEVVEKASGYMMAAFGFVAGLAWNEAIKSFIEYAFPLDKNTLWAKFLYAIVMTAVVVWASWFFVRMSQKNDSRQ